MMPRFLAKFSLRSGVSKVPPTRRFWKTLEPCRSDNSILDPKGFDVFQDLWTCTSQIHNALYAFLYGKLKERLHEVEAFNTLWSDKINPIDFGIRSERVRISCWIIPIEKYSFEWRGCLSRARCNKDGTICLVQQLSEFGASPASPSGDKSRH